MKMPAKKFEAVKKELRKVVGVWTTQELEKWVTGLYDFNSIDEAQYKNLMHLIPQTRGSV